MQIGEKAALIKLRLNIYSDLNSFRYIPFPFTRDALISSNFRPPNHGNRTSCELCWMKFRSSPCKLENRRVNNSTDSLPGYLSSD